MWTSHLRRTVTMSFRTSCIYKSSSAATTVTAARFFISKVNNAEKNDYLAAEESKQAADGGGGFATVAAERFYTAPAKNAGKKAVTDINGDNTVTEEKVGSDETVKARIFTATVINAVNKVATERFYTAPVKNDVKKAVKNIDGDNRVAEENIGGYEKAKPRFFTSPVENAGNKATETEKMSLEEVKKLMRLVNVEELKMKLAEEGKEVVSYGELLKACQGFGVARSVDEAVEFAKALDDAGVVLLFRDKVYLHPDKVVELITSSVPLALTPEDDPRREELKRLQERKEEIDRQAHKQVRVILWSGLGIAIMQVGLFFRLTFWEFSWDVMEPIAFFTTATGLVIGYAYFMITSRDPTYQDLMKRLFMSRQRKLLKKYHFDIVRFKELSDKCKCPSDKKHCSDNLIL